VVTENYDREGPDSAIANKSGVSIAGATGLEPATSGVTVRPRELPLLAVSLFSGHLRPNPAVRRWSSSRWSPIVVYKLAPRTAGVEFADLAPMREF